MPDEDDGVVEEGESTPPPAKKNPDPVPYSRFREVVQQRRDLETKLTAAESALSTAETEKLAALKKRDEVEAASTAEIDDLKAKLSARDADMQKYKEAIAAAVDETTKEWPDEVKVFDPGADADPIVRMEWSKKAQLLVAKLGAQQGGAGVGLKPPPKQSVAEQKQAKPAVDVKRSF